MIVTLFMFIFQFAEWSLAFSLDIAPLSMLAGVSLEMPGEETGRNTTTLVIAVPTLRLEISWASNERLAEIEKLMEEAEAR